MAEAERRSDTDKIAGVAAGYNMPLSGEQQHFIAYAKAHGPLPFRRNGLFVVPDSGNKDVHWITYIPHVAEPEQGRLVRPGIEALRVYTLMTICKIIPRPAELRASETGTVLRWFVAKLGFEDAGDAPYLGSEYRKVRAGFETVAERLGFPKNEVPAIQTATQLGGAAVEVVNLPE